MTVSQVTKRRRARTGPRLVLGQRDDGVVTVGGELDIATGRVLERYAAPLDVVRLDLSAVTFMDSSGFDALVRIHERCRTSGRPCAIERSSPSVRRVRQLIELPPSLNPLLGIIDSAAGSRVGSSVAAVVMG